MDYVFISDNAPISFLQTGELLHGEPGNMDILRLLYAAALVFVVILVIGIFLNRGPLVISGIIAYLLSLSTITLTVKSVFVHQKFNYPKFLTCCHFLACGFVCFGIMAYKQMTGQKPMPVPSFNQMSRKIVPIAFSFAASVGINNVALVYCGAGFAEMMMGAAPLCVICLNVVEGSGFDMRLLWPVLSVVAGVCMCTGGELSFTWFGLGLIFLANFLRAWKSNIQYKVLENEDPAEKLEPIELLAWMSLPSLALMGTWGVLTEGIEPFSVLTWQTSLAIGVTCVNACVLNVANNFVIRDLGPVGCLLAGQLKGILLLMGATVLLGEIIQAQQLVGYVFIAGGIFVYNKMDKEFKDAKAANIQADIESTQEKVPIVKKKP
jgi:hypothetical protein